MKKEFVLILVVLLFVRPQCFCASKKKSAATNNNSESAGVKLAAPKRTFFYKIDSDIVNLVESGSPENIRLAMAKIRKSESEYADNERVLIAVSTGIMRNVYPSEKITWENVTSKEDNPYIGAIYSANQGIFDRSTGNLDFLTIVLPCIFILKPNNEVSDYDDCLKSLELGRQLNPESVLVNYLSGIIYEKLGNYSQSEIFLQKAHSYASENLEISLAYARSLRNNYKADKAAEILQVFPADTNNLDILKEQAYCAFSKKDYANAELYVAKVLQQTPNNLEFLLFRARILIEKGDYIHAVSLLDVYSRQNDTSIDYLILRSKVQLDWSKNVSLATETIEKALKLYPNNTEALMIAAKISAVTDAPVAGKYADELSEKVLANNPHNQDALLYALNGLTKRENWQAAYDISSKLVEATSDSEIFLKHVEVCLKLGKKTEAFELSKKKYNENPADEALLQSYVQAYSQVGTRDQVTKFIDSLLPNVSTKMKSFLYYRRSFLEPNEDAVLTDLRSSLISNPRNSDALFRLYEVYYSKKDYRKAQYYLRQVVAINPNDSSVKQLNEALTKLIQ